MVRYDKNIARIANVVQCHFVTSWTELNDSSSLRSLIELNQIITRITQWTDRIFFSWFYFCLLNCPPTLFVIRPEPRNKSWSWGAWGDDWCKFDSQIGKQKIVKYICFRFFTSLRMPTLTDLVPLILENLSRWWSRWDNYLKESSAVLLTKMQWVAVVIVIVAQFNITPPPASAPFQIVCLTIVCIAKLIVKSIDLREHLPQTKMFYFRALPEKGGGPCPNFLALFPPVTVLYILTSISCYVYTFWSFFTFNLKVMVRYDKNIARIANVVQCHN